MTFLALFSAGNAKQLTDSEIANCGKMQPDGTSVFILESGGRSPAAGTIHCMHCGFLLQRCIPYIYRRSGLKMLRSLSVKRPGGKDWRQGVEARDVHTDGTALRTAKP